MNTTVEQLRPCPFCGSPDVEMYQSVTDALVRCDDCGSRSGYVFLGADEASNAYRLRELAAAWNTRFAEQSEMQDA